uniref:DNA-directed DNA polymerase n=1 Tax=Amanita pseudoporphyria TaxID=67725 RepID=A0A5Q0N1Z3_9AGAR|nr:DNA polymerase type B [Amanita pseudoporphyria]QFZ98515.1 DNA polymerase type B [Amanita pseudoporphyria]
MKIQINKINGNINTFIRKSYTGGHVDVYKLYSNKITYLYDFISLYPTVMSNYKVPVKLINHFIGNPIKTNTGIDYLHSDTISSFIKCDIFVDPTLNRPVYQTHINLNSQLKTLCATGLFKNQHVFLPEMLEYSRLTNNKIRIIEESITEGYRFESKVIFNEYINSLFEIKKSVNKTDPMYLISKILMNSLYGRFGLKPDLSQFNLISNKEIDNFILNKGLPIYDIFNVEDTSKSFVINKKLVDTLDINVAIAAAITSYARVIMAPILLDEDIPVLYTDTDSFVTEVDLSTTKYKDLLHNNLGGLKLENIFTEFVSIAPKVYGGILTDESKIVKIKGFKDKVEFDSLKDLLLNKQSLNLTQSKWYKSFNKGKSFPLKHTLNVVGLHIYFNRCSSFLIHNLNVKFLLIINGVRVYKLLLNLYKFL